MHSVKYLENFLNQLFKQIFLRRRIRLDTRVKMMGEAHLDQQLYQQLHLHVMLETFQVIKFKRMLFLLIL